MAKNSNSKPQTTVTLKNGKSKIPASNGPSKTAQTAEIEAVRQYLQTSCPIPKDSPVLKEMFAKLNDLEETPQKASSVRSKPRRGLWCFVVLMEASLVLLWGVYTSLLLLDWIQNDYLQPQLQLMEWTEDRANTEVSYYHRECTPMEMTANDTTQLLLPSPVSPSDAQEHLLKHGMSIYPNVLSKKTAQQVRDFVIAENQKGGGFWVIEGENRHSFGIRVDQHDSIRQALIEIATHASLRPALDRILGDNPAVVEFTAITSTYGATDQYAHQDVVPDGSATKYVRNYVPTYSLFLPLQDTTHEMGATEVCPGSHVCAFGAEEVCEDYAFSVAGSNNRWPMGWGALLNQQLTHRGMAHMDPNAPDRAVLIITLASRPRFLGAAVETRILGKSGSYSLHWSQWGQTLDDFVVSSNLAYRMLRTFGIFKPASSHWGWDMVTVASMRIANRDNGYMPEELDDFVKAGGFDFLPQQLQGDASDGWYVFLVDTLRRCRRAAGWTTVVALALYVVGMILQNYFTKTRSISYGRAAGRLAVFYGIVVCMAFIAHRRVANTPWARNIRSSRLYRLGGEATTDPEFPETLPTTMDVLFGSHYSSEYFAAYSKILDVSHPGNAVWNEYVLQNARGYRNLPPSLQEKLTKNLLVWIQEEQRRFLSQTDDGNWYELSDMEAQERCHKELSMASHPVLWEVVKLLDSLMLETKFGYWRDTSMHTSTIPLYLQALQDAFLGEAPRLEESSLAKEAYHRGWKLPVLPSAGRRLTPRTPSSLFASVLPKEPYLGAWLTVGDRVESRYRGEFDEWYAGTLVGAWANTGTYSVVYDDGDEDPDLCRKCVRPFEPYKLDEVVEVKVNDNEDAYFRGRVTRVHGDEVYDVWTEQFGAVQEVAPNRMRRFTSRELTVGTRIEALWFGEGDEWFPGEITHVRDDRSFDVKYDDGDVEQEVELEHIRFAMDY